MIFVAVLAALTAYVAAPLYRASVAAGGDEGRGALEARRDALIAALRELELDHQRGALDEDGYLRLRAATEAEAAAVLRRLAD